MRSSACCNRSCDLLSLWLCLQLTLVSRRHQWVDPLGWSGTCILCGPPTGRSTLTVASHSTGWIRDGRQGKTTHDVIAILIFLTETVVHAEWFGRLSYFLRGAGQTDQLLREICNHSEILGKCPWVHHSPLIIKCILRNIYCIHGLILLL